MNTFVKMFLILIWAGKYRLERLSKWKTRVFFIFNLLVPILDLQYSEWCFLSTFQFTEAATGGVLLKKMVLKISQVSQENNCVGVSFY